MSESDSDSSRADAGFRRVKNVRAKLKVAFRRRREIRARIKEAESKVDVALQRRAEVEKLIAALSELERRQRENKFVHSDPFRRLVVACFDEGFAALRADPSQDAAVDVKAPFRQLHKALESAIQPSELNLDKDLRQVLLRSNLLSLESKIDLLDMLPLECRVPVASAILSALAIGLSIEQILEDRFSAASRVAMAEEALRNLRHQLLDREKSRQIAANRAKMESMQRRMKVVQQVWISEQRAHPTATVRQLILAVALAANKDPDTVRAYFAAKWSVDRYKPMKRKKKD